MRVQTGAGSDRRAGRGLLWTGGPRPL